MKVGDLVKVQLSHSRTMLGLIMDVDENVAHSHPVGYVTYTISCPATGRKARALQIDMELISEVA